MDTPNRPNSTIYEQDCEFYKYQDKLMWSRFQTAALVEGALLYGLYQLCLPIAEKRLFLVAGPLFVLVICLLSLKDSNDANRHIKRISNFEIDSPLPEGKLPKHSGFWLMLLAVIILTVGNGFFIWLKW